MTISCANPVNICNCSMMTGELLLFVFGIICATSAEGYTQDFGKCYSNRYCQKYTSAGGVWTKEDCCQAGNPCWCDQNSRCQPSCSSTTNQQINSNDLGKCYSTRNCQDYSVAGGMWTKSDCCSSRGLCWCDRFSEKCQLSCSTSNTPSIGTLGKCYSTRNCQSYSVSGGKWTKVDCCSSGGLCWCDQYGRCQPSCLDSTKLQVDFETLGKCYTTRDCQHYSSAGGKWTKEDCCLSSSRCWCDKNERCQPSCSNSTNQHSISASFGKCYSTRDCQYYSVAGGSWTKKDCCLSGGRCWCDRSKRCQLSCSSSTTQQATFTALGKCYSTRDCQSYSKAGGTWTKEDCCLSGGRCWCDRTEVCQPSCSSSASQQLPTQSPTEEDKSLSSTTHLDKTLSSTTQLASQYVPTTSHFTPTTSDTDNPGFSTQHPKPATSALGKCYSTRDCRPQSVAHGMWTIEDCCLSGNPCWCNKNKQCQASCTIPISQQKPAPETQTVSTISTSIPTYRTSGNLMYLWFLVAVTVFPCLCCFWICYYYKRHLPNNLNLTYVKINTNSSTSAEAV